MKKTTTRIVYVGMLSIAALVLGQKMFTEDPVVSDDQTRVELDSAGSVIAGSYSKNIPSVEHNINFVSIEGGVGSFSVDDDIIFSSQDSIYKDEDWSGEGGYGNTIRDAGDSESIIGGHNRNGSGAIYASPMGSAINSPSDSRRISRLHRGGNGASGLGGVGGGGGNGEKDKDGTGKDPAGNTPGENTGVTPSQENTSPANEDKNDPGHSNTPGGNDHDNDESASSDPSDKGAPPEYFDGTPGKEPIDPFQPPVSNEEIGNQDNGGAGTPGSNGAEAIPEPVSSLLIGLGSAMLLWSRRRSGRS